MATQFNTKKLPPQPGGSCFILASKRSEPFSKWLADMKVERSVVDPSFRVGKGEIGSKLPGRHDDSRHGLLWPPGHICTIKTIRVPDAAEVEQICVSATAEGPL